MIHILDHQTDEILDFVTLDNIIEDNHKKSLEDTLETYDFIAFGDRRYSEFLEKRNRIIIPDEDGTLREFVIFENARYLDTEGRKIQTFAHASYLELKKAAVVYPSKFKGTASQHGGRALNGTGWSIGLVEVEGDITININEHTVPYDYLKRIAKEFDGELSFRIEHDGSKVTGRYVDILERVGTWQGREVEFGKDLDSIRRVEKQDIVTALLGLGPEREDGTRIEVLVEDNDALQRWGRIDEHNELQHLIEPYEIQSERSEMTLTEARRYTRTALDKRINTQITYETTILDLEEVAGHENKKIRFGDTIKIKDTKFNPPLYLEARVFEMTRSIKRKDKKDIKLGDFIEHTEEDVNAIWNQLKKEIQNRVSFYEMAEYTYDKLTIDDKDETVFEDGKTFAEATGIQAREDAKAFAVEEDAKIRTDVETEIIKLDEQSERYAQSALEQAKMYAVSKEVYDNQMTQIANDIEGRAPLEYVDGKFTVVEDDLEKFSAEIEKKADGNTVYTIEDVDNMINNTVSKTQYETDKEGIVTELESQGTRIGQNEHAIGLKADSSELDAVESSLTTKIGNVEVTAEGAKMTASEVRADLDGLEYENRNLLVNSKGDNLDGWSAWSRSEIRVIDGAILVRKGSSPSSYGIETNRGFILNAGKTYTLSLDIASNFRTSILDYVYILYKDGQGNQRIDHIVMTNAHADFKRYSIHFTPVRDCDDCSILFGAFVKEQDYPTEGFLIKEVKLEKGNKATDWTPAPEDTDEAISNVSGRVETLDGEITALAGEVSLKASQSVVDSLEGRVSTAEGELRVLPGQINAKVSKDGVVGAINATPERLLIDFDKVNITGQLEAKHIKSLAGLNINDQFIVDSRGNATFAGKLEAKEGYFGDNIRLRDGKMEIVRPDGAVSMSNGMVDTGYSVLGADPHFMGVMIAGGTRGQNAFIPGGMIGYPNSTTSSHIYANLKGLLDGRGVPQQSAGYYSDIREPMGTIPFQRYYFVHSARYLVFAFRKYTGAKYSVHVMKNASGVVDDRLLFKLYEKDDAGIDYLTVDLGTPTFEKRNVTFKIGWTNGWGPRDEMVRFIMENVYLTDFID